MKQLLISLLLVANLGFAQKVEKVEKVEKVKTPIELKKEQIEVLKQEIEQLKINELVPINADSIQSKAVISFVTDSVSYLIIKVGNKSYKIDNFNMFFEMDKKMYNLTKDGNTLKVRGDNSIIFTIQ